MPAAHKQSHPDVTLPPQSDVDMDRKQSNAERMPSPIKGLLSLPLYTGGDLPILTGNKPILRNYTVSPVAPSRYCVQTLTCCRSWYATRTS